MRQQVQDATSVEYAGGLEAIWHDWDPWLRRAERLLHDAGPELLGDNDAREEMLRRIQYHAHTSAEFTAGLNPPIAAIDSHEFLVAALGACRDTMGALAMQAEEYDDLDDQAVDIGLHAIASTRDAFHAARCSTMASFAFTEGMEPMYVTSNADATRVQTLVWGLVTVGGIMLTTLIYVLVVLTAGA